MFILQHDRRLSSPLIKFLICSPTVILLFLSVFSVCLVSPANALQFFLQARSRKCFREDIPLSTDALLTYTIAQGSGDMPITLRVTDVSGAIVHERRAADHGVVSFSAPDAIPHVHEKANTWALRDDDHDEDDAGLLRVIPGAVGDNRVPYSVCFEHPRTLHLPRLTGRDAVPRRRVIFTLKYGTQSRGQEFYDKLAKEKHLSSTEELFRVVEDRVGEIVRGIDELRQRELRITHMAHNTSRGVVGYSILACITIVVGAVYASSATASFLSKKKVR